MHPDSLSREQAQSLADDIVALPGVAGLNGGQFGEVALLYPGAKVQGLRISAPRTDPQSPRLEVSVVAKASDLPNLDDLAESVRHIVSNYTDLPVDVTISDVV